jgi:hypothetical protein
MIKNFSKKFDKTAISKVKIGNGAKGIGIVANKGNTGLELFSDVLYFLEIN